MFFHSLSWVNIQKRYTMYNMLFNVTNSSITSPSLPVCIKKYHWQIRMTCVQLIVHTADASESVFSRKVSLQFHRRHKLRYTRKKCYTCQWRWRDTMNVNDERWMLTMSREKREERLEYEMILLIIRTSHELQWHFDRHSVWDKNYCARGRV